MGDASVDLPCTGVFVMENGKIKIWRDYFDLATFQNAAQNAAQNATQNATQNAGGD